jgi:hypothetical protein
MSSNFKCRRVYFELQVKVIAHCPGICPSDEFFLLEEEVLNRDMLL